MQTNKFYNPKLQILNFSLFLVIYHYYEFSISLNSYAYKYSIKNRNEFIYILFALSPFTFSSLARPFGGIISAWWQRKTDNCIFPTLLLIFSCISIIVNSISNLTYIESIAKLIIFLRVLQGLLIGGIIPHYFIYYYENSSNTLQKIFFCVGFFVTIYIAVLLSGVVVHLLPLSIQYWFNIVIDFILLLISGKAYQYRHAWGKFILGRVLATKSIPLLATIKTNYGSILRLSMFISFMASINSFFLTVMPFYLIHFLYYKAADVFLLSTISTAFGIIGFLLSGYYHKTIGKKWHLSIGIILKIILFILFRLYVHHDLALTILFGSLCLFFTGLLLGKTPLILNSIFPANTRLHAISITYNLSHGLMFGFSGFIEILLLIHFHNLYIPSLFILFFSYMSIISLWYTPEKDFYRYIDEVKN